MTPMGFVVSGLATARAPATAADLRAHVKQGPASTEELQSVFALTQREVWARLRGDLERGRLKREAGKWAWGIPADVEQAIAFLEQHGYTVHKPRACDINRGKHP